MEVVLRCKDYLQVDALTVVDFTMLYAVTLRRWLLLSSRVSSLVVNSLRIVNKLITNNETRDENNKWRVTPTVKLEPNLIKHCGINNG